MKKIFCYGKKNEKGITLTALVITVVVLSAIAAVGLKAADSEIKSVNEIQNEAQKQEDKLENTGKQINKMYDDLDIKDVDLTAEIKQTTCSFEISNVQLQNSSEIIGRYKYFIKEKDSSSYREISSTKDNFMTMDKLRHNTQYDIKIEVYNQSGKKIKTSVKTAKTNELTAGSLILKLKDNAGAEYTPGTWTASDVYVRQVEGNAGKTTYQTVGSSAQTIAQGTSGETIVSKSGVTTIRVITTDGTNTVNGKDYVIKIDKEAPISGALKMQLDNNNGAEYKNDTWTKHDVYVSLQQGNSNLSGIKSTVYNVTGAESHTNQTQPLTLKTTGTYTINVITTNNVGTTSTKTYTVKIDKDAPEAGKLIMKLGDNKGNDYTDGTWTNQNVYIAKQDGTDALSGHKSTVYNVTGKSNISNTQDAITLTETGEYTLTVITTDNAENTSTRIYKVKIDKVNPTTPEVTNPSNGEWTKGQVKITIKSTDANSGIDRIEWFENGAWTTRQLTTTNGVGTITYTVDRNTVIRFRAVDKAGNISDEVTTTIKLDTSTPDKQAPEATSTPSTIKVTFKQTDHLSGINGSTIRYAIYKDGKWSAWQTSDTFTGLIHNAEYKVKTQVSDNVGNTSESNETTISTKKLEAGTLKLNLINASGNSYVSGQWTKSNVYVSLSQAQYGTSNYESISGSAQTVATGTTADSLITKAGITTLRVKTVDGPNTVYSQNYIVKVDNQNPTAGTLTMKLNSSTGSTYTSGNWTNQNVWIHKNDGSDNLSGHQSTTYNVSGAETLNNQTADNTIQTEGTYTLTVKTLDKVSNSSTRGYTVKIDKTAPTDVAPIATATTNSITATFKQTDSLSGINNSSIQYAIKDGNSWSSWQTSKTFTGLKTNQTYIIKTKATDNAGNTRESKELSITTTELKAGTLTLTKETATGSAYTSGQWSNKNVYVKLVQSSTGTSTYSSTSNSAQLVSAGTTVDTTVSTNGTTTLKVTTTDGNNTAYSQEYVIKVDKELPTTTSPTVSSTTNTITVTCNQTDSLSGINASSKKYAIYKNGAWSAWQTSNKFTNLTHNTEYKVKTQITDNAGNTSESVEATAKTTTLTAGTLTLRKESSTGSIYQSGTWSNKSIYVTLTKSSIGTTTYESVTGSAQTVTPTDSATKISADGTTTVRVKTTDGINTVYSKEYVIKIDTVAPTAGKMALKLDNSSGGDYTENTWTNHSVYAALTNGSDTLSGHKSTTYSITGGATVSNATAATTLATTNTYTIKVTTIDNAGNSATRTQIVKIDKEAPTAPEITNPSNGAWTNGNVTITAKSTDAHSGIDRIEWYENNAWTTRALTTTNGTGTISYTANRNETVRFRAVDKVGNVSAEATTIVKIDKTAPTNTAPTATVTAQSITVTCKQTDSLSGIKSGTTQYALKTGDTWSAWQTSNTFTKLKQSTSYVVKTKVTDNAGNSAESSETTVYTSKLAAGTLTLKHTDASGAAYTSNTWTKDNVYVTLNNGSAGTTTYASVSGSAQTVAAGTTGATTIEAAGTTTLKVTTTDGTNTSTNSYIIKIDKTAPTVGTLTMKLGSSTGTTYTSGNWTNQNVWVHKNDGSDSQSGHKSTTYTISAASLTNQTADNTLTKEGKYTAVVTTTDNVSNSSTKNYNINIDKTAPTTVAPTAFQTTNSITVTNKQTDALSGVSSTQYAIYNGSSWSSWQSSNVFSGLTTNKTYKVKTKTTDKAGNSSESAELSVTTSNLTAGSLTLKHTNASGAAYTANTWTKDSVYVTLNNGSAGTTTYASISGSAQTVAATSSATTITTSGTTKLVVTTTDVTNTVKSGEYIIKVDKNAPTNTAPTTSVTTNSVTVTCKQTDSLSGINASTTQYAIYKGSSWSAWQTSNKFTGLTHNTSYKVKTKISDNVGNSGESAETTVSTSKLAAGSLTLKHTNASGAAYTLGSWSTTDIYVTLTRASTGTTTYESISGSAQTVATGTTAATTITTAGTTTLRVKTTDGTNTVYSSNYVIKIDKTKPTAGTMTMKLGSSTGSTYTSGIWTNQSVYIALNNGSDETGGSGHSSTTYSISGAATQSNQTAAQTLTAAGKYTITITTKDIAGNSSTRTQYIYIDKTKPTAGTLTMKLDSSTGSSYSNNTWTNHSVYISLNNGSDETNGSGHSSTTYSISGSATQSNQTAAQTLLATGTYNITVTTKDKAGNTSTNNYVIKIDKKAPNVGTLTMKLDSASGENYTNDTWTNHNIYIAVNNGNDANSGHQSTTYSISGPITVTNSSEARTLTAEGTYTVVLTTKDMAGNTATRTYTIKVDKTPPQVQLSNNGGDFNIKSREELLNYSDYNKISSEWTTRITYGSASHNDTDVENSNFYGNFPSVALNLNVSYKNSLSIFSKQKLDVTNIDKIVLKAFLYENGPNNDMINTTRFGLATSDAEADKNWLTYVQKEYKGSPETCENGTVAQTVNYETFEIDTTSIVGEYYVQLNVSHNFLGGYTATTHIETMYYEYNSSTVGNMSSKISCSDNNGISNVRYSWSTSSTQEPANWTNITNNSLVNQKLKKGSYYLWVKATDNVGNEKIFVSSPYNVNYEISYDTNGSSQPPKTQTKIPGKQLTLTEEIPTRRGYTFKCWNTKEDGTGTNYYPGSIYQNDESITLCAIWNRNIVPDLRKPNVTFTQTPSELTSGNVTVNVSISSDLISRGYTLQTSKNYNTGWTDASSQIATENYDRIYARLRDNNGNFGDYVTYIVQNIDKYPPVIQQITVVSNGIKLTVIDPYNGVITGYAITENNAQPSTFIDCYVGTLDTTITNIALTKGKTYYIWVRDRMNFITYKTITI